MLWIKEVEMSIRWTIFKLSRSIRGFSHFPNFWDAGCDDCVCSEQDHPEFLLQGKGQSGGTESSVGTSFLSRNTDRSHDLRLLPVYWRSWHCSWLRWSVHNHSLQWWCSWIRYEMGWNSICLWSRSYLVMSWKVWTNWEHVRLINSKPFWSCMTWRFMKICRCQIVKNWRQWWREAQIRNLFCETLTPDMRELKQEQWLRIAGVNVVLKEDKENAFNGKQKDSVREETSVVSGTMKTSVQNRHQKNCSTFLNHQQRGGSVRGKERQRPESTWGVRDSRAKIP